MITNPIKYTSRTFKSILTDINSDAELSSKPNWWKRLWAGIGDVLSMWLNSMVNLVFLRTAYTSSAVADLCELIDYYLSAQTTSSGKVMFYVDSSLGFFVFPFTLALADVKAKSQGSLSVSSKTFQADIAQVIPANFDTFTGDAVNSALDLTAQLLYPWYRVQFTNNGGALPTPLVANTDYYTVIYQNDNPLSPKTRIATTLANAMAGIYVTIFSVGTGLNKIQYFSVALDLKQQEYINSPVDIGTSDGASAWQSFNFPDRYVLPDSVVITINSITWTEVTTFVNSIASDTVYKLVQLSDGSLQIRFGNGVYGMIPPAYNITANYSTGGGASSNILSLNYVNVYAGSDSKITGVVNVEAMTGGADAEDIENAKQLAPLLLKTRDRFVTADDGRALVLGYGGVTQAVILTNFYGPLSCKVVGVASGGGNPSSTLSTAIQNYLVARSILNSIYVNFAVATITAINVSSSAKMLPGYVFTGGVDKYFRLAYKLFLTKTGREIQIKYQSEGIVNAVALINTIFSESFAESDYAQITKLLNVLEPRNFGDVIQQSDLFAFIQSNVDGIDYMTITTFGSGLPLTLAVDEITTYGTLTLTEI